MKVDLNIITSGHCTNPSIGANQLWRFPDHLNKKDRIKFELHRTECPYCEHAARFTFWLIQSSQKWGCQDLVYDLKDMSAVAMNDNDYARGERLLTELVRIAPRDPDGLFNLGRCKMYVGKRDEAKRAWEEVLRQNPRHVYALSGLGRIKFEEGDYAEAERLIRASIELYPQDPWPFHTLALIMMKQRRFEDAIATVQSVIALNSNYPGAHHALVTALLLDATHHVERGRPDRAQQQFDAACDLEPGLRENRTSNVDVLYNLALFRQSRKEDDVAAVLYEAVLASNPRHLGSLVNLAFFQLRNGRIAEGKALIEKCMQYYPKNAMAYNGLGLLHESQKDFHRALQAYLRANQLDRDSVPPLFNLGRLHFLQGQYRKAHSYFERATQRYPDATNIRVVIAGCLIYLDRVDDALDHLKSAMAQNPDDYGVLSYAGVCYMHQGKPQAAIEHFLRAVRVAPNRAEARFNLGSAYYSLKKYSDAAKAFEESVTYNPNFTEAYNNLGLCLENLGHLENAQKAFIAALALKPDDAGTISNLAVCEFLLGNFDRAEELLQNALNLDPDHIGIRSNLERVHALRKRGALRQLHGFEVYSKLPTLEGAQPMAA